MQNSSVLDSNNLKRDLPAGLVVFLVALPLCLGISLASGAPLFAGVITGIVGGILVSWLSGSNLSVSGPAAGLTVIVLDAIHELKAYETFLFAGFVAGIMQLILGFARAGGIGMYFPSGVIKGMLAAIGLTIILKQLPYFIGAPKDFTKDMKLFQEGGNSLATLPGYILSNIEPGSFIIGAAALAVIVLWGHPALKNIQISKLVPGALIAVVGSVLLNLGLRAMNPDWAVNPNHLVSLPVMSNPFEITNHFRFPDFSQFGNPIVYKVAITLAIVASLETLLSTEAVDKLDPQRRTTPSNRELKAQGIGNMVAATIGGIPMTAVIVRSAANVGAGGQTKMSSFVHGVLLLLSVVFLAPFINMIPLSALAAVLLSVGYKLTSPASWKAQWKLGWEQFIPFAVTIAAILIEDLLIGVAIGLVVGIFFVLKAHYKLPFHLRHEVHPEEPAFHIQLAPNATFLHKAKLVSTLQSVPQKAQVTIDGSKSSHIDYDVLEAIQNFKNMAVHKNIKVNLINIPEIAVAGGH